MSAGHVTDLVGDDNVCPSLPSLQYFLPAGLSVSITIATRQLATSMDPVRVITAGFGKSRKSATNVMPAKAGIQKYQVVTKALDPGFRRGDDVFRVRHHWFKGIIEQ